MMQSAIWFRTKMLLLLLNWLPPLNVSLCLLENRTFSPLLLTGSQDDCNRWMHFLKENSYTSLRQLCDEAEAGMRSMATVLVLFLAQESSVGGANRRKEPRKAGNDSRMGPARSPTGGDSCFSHREINRQSVFLYFRFPTQDSNR